MFSATWPMSVRQLASEFMTSPLRITVGSDSLTANSRVEQSAIVVDNPRDKESLLLTQLRANGFSLNAAQKGGKGADREKVLVFALYKKEATRIYDMLNNKGYEVACINGDMSQDKRTQSLANFKSGKSNILVATGASLSSSVPLRDTPPLVTDETDSFFSCSDVAARGLDIPKVELVINQTFPLTIEDVRRSPSFYLPTSPFPLSLTLTFLLPPSQYIHRIGRTGRAGRTGKSITFFTEADKALAGQFIRVLRDSNMPVPPGLDQWGTTIKKTVHSSYGAHFKEPVEGTAKKIKFD